MGVARETCLGEDANGARTTRAARRAAVAGVPTIAVSVPTRSPDAPAAPAATALARLLRAVARVVPTDAPVNCPRSHFPFPTRGRWSAVGTAQLPLDAALAAQLFARDVGDFAAEDCWSLGASLGAALARGNAKRRGGWKRPTRLTPAEARAAVRDAFGEGDVFLSVSVPPRHANTARRRDDYVRGGQAGRALAATDGARGVSKRRRARRRNRRGPVRGVEGTRGDARCRFNLWATRARARPGRGSCVSCATEAAVNGRLETASTVTSEHRRRPPPRGFRTGPGTVVADDSAGGDVDVVMGNKAAVCARHLLTWPHGHAFSLLDHVAAEAASAARTRAPACPCGCAVTWLCE